jgi:ribonuclease PH
MTKRSTPRKIKIIPHTNPYALGSVMAFYGQTQILITVSQEENVPPFLKGKNRGWLSAEYSLLPHSTHTRVQRERKGASGRTQEIQRLIGRSLRTLVDFEKMGERSFIVDCDVIVADGSTRTCAISGACVALQIAFEKLISKGLLSQSPMINTIGALSVGIDKNTELKVDLNYEEDSECQTDLNIVMTKTGKIVEIQGTAEKEPFSRSQLNEMLDLAWIGMQDVFKAQELALLDAGLK